MTADDDGSLLLTDIGELVTNRDDAADLLGVVRDAAVAIEGGRVTWCGTESRLPERHRSLPVHACGGAAVLPGFVDAHTHVVFAGDRADEFARRLRGERYEDVLASGGGIRATVAATRSATHDQLVEQTRPRLARMLAHGTTTAEVKSGYGLDVDTERRTLEAVATLSAEQPIDLVPTFCGAHLVPEEFDGDREAYLDLVIDEALPACAPLARFGDVFCDVGAFTVDESRRVLRACRDQGLDLRIHAEELGRTGGAALAAELGAASADHLAYASRDDADALRAAGVTAVLLPTTSFSLGGSRFADGRMLRDAGVALALGTDCNPGTSYTESMSFAVALACLQSGLTAEEAVWAATRGSARSLRLDDRGWLGPGARGDVVVLDAPSYAYLPYRPGVNLVREVVVAGQVVIA